MTTGTGPAPWPDRDEWRRWQSAATGGWQVVDPEAQPVPGRGNARRISGSNCATGTWFPTPSSGTPSSTDRPLPREPRSTLITDFYSYNTNLTADGSDLVDEPRGETGTAWMQPHWVGDLTLSAGVEVTSPGRASDSS